MYNISLINNDRSKSLNYLQIFLILKESSKLFYIIDKYIISNITTMVRWYNETINISYDVYRDLMVNEKPEIIKYIKYKYYDLCMRIVKTNGLMLEYIENQSTEICHTAYLNNQLAFSFINDSNRSLSIMLSDNYKSKSININHSTTENNSDDYFDDNSEDNIDLNVNGEFCEFISMMKTCCCCKSLVVLINEYNVCERCMISNKLEVYIVLLNKVKSKNYLNGECVNYGYCHRCGIKNENIFCDTCKVSILSYNFCNY